MIFGDSKNSVEVKQRADGTWYCSIAYNNEGIYKLLEMMSPVIYKAELALREHNVVDDVNKKKKGFAARM